MPLLRRCGFTVLALLFAAAACDEVPTTVLSPDATATPELSASTASSAATSEREAFSEPFPPFGGYAEVPAPCLDLGAPLRMSGTWTGWRQVTTTAAGREHLTRYNDYSQITVYLGEMTWLPGPGAHEVVTSNWPSSTAEALPPGGFTYRHQFNAVFRSQQDGLPDLRIHHLVKETVNGNLEFVHAEFVPFAAECIGNGG